MFIRIVLVISAIFAAPLTLAAQSFMMMPGTIVFEGRTRSAAITVQNTADRRAVFQVEPVGFLSDESGQLREVPVEDMPRGAAGMVRFSPRQFELQPGENQTVRLGIRKPASLAPGEYTVHLRVRQLPAADAPSAVDVADEARVVIPISIARAVRVTIRHNVIVGRAEIGALSARRSGAEVVMSATFLRTGGGSSSGEYVIAAPGGAEQVEKGSIHIHSEMSRRVLERRIPLAALDGIDNVCLIYSDAGGEAKRYCTAISGL
jgi:P pilus assembly chaperone PapD